jgi:hypothetical protein
MWPFPVKSQRAAFPAQRHLVGYLNGEASVDGQYPITCLSAGFCCWTFSVNCFDHQGIFESSELPLYNCDFAEISLAV